MSTSSNISQSAYSPSEPETPQGTTQNRLQNFDQSLNHSDLGHSIEQSLKNAQKEMHQKRVQALRKELDYLKSTEWEFEYDKGFVHYFVTQTDEDDDDNKENFLADQLVDLEVENEQYNYDPEKPSDIPRDAHCYQRTGVITFMSDNNYILIDGMLHYDLSSSSVNVQVGDKVLYLAYSDVNEKVVVVRILENQGICWGNEELVEEDIFQVINHVIVGEVDNRQDRFVYMNESDLKFSLDNVEATFVPIKGDWLELNCKVQWDENKPCDISSAQVLQVISLKPLRSKIKEGIVTAWSGEYGTCDRLIYFDKQSFQNGVVPEVGSKVMIHMIESNQGSCTWRAIELIVIEKSIGCNISVPKLTDEEDRSLNLEKERNVEISYPLKFEKLDINSSAVINLSVTNNSNEVQFINKWVMLCKKRDSQINIEPFLTRPKKLLPKETFTFSVTCRPKFLGNTKETLIIMMKNLQTRRLIDITIVDEHSNLLNNEGSKTSYNGSSTLRNMESMRNIRRNDKQSFLPGERLNKAPAFVSVRLGTFPIPDKVWSAALGDSDQTAQSNEFNKILQKIEEKIPCLTQELNIHNYLDKWHNLVYMEEIQNNLSMRTYDRKNVFLIRCQEYLALEVNGLAEQRPSIILGDRVVVRDNWDSTALLYEGFVHAIKGDMILMKFNQRFHEIYTGSDVSIEFHGNRSTYRRCHQAINSVLSNLGPDILFPCKVSPQPKQLPTEKIESIEWFNTTLNSGQKAAVRNILSGECRPLPYCIFGPPGTGKTVTVIETILQILRTLPESRLLVAAPSNSAANLITERLLKYRDKFSDSMVRIIAHYLVGTDKIPDEIKPFCATLDLAMESNSKPKHIVKNGININSQTSFIGRHRVTIGTCYSIGTLALMGLPKGHFTHVIVDEAGQATEPEIMIPMAFVDKNNAQIILAGDPMQLGPVIMSKYCLEYGMDESYLSRILKTFPYQKDFAAFQGGYDQRLITKLTDNYRSLKEVLAVPSEMFYDSSLVANLEENQSWVVNIVEVVNEIFGRSDSKTGGIYVYGIKGINLRAQDSPSWYNSQEASMVALTTCKLYKKYITADDIGIITPYIAQIKYLKLVFEAMGLPQPKIGTVEDFQGQERRIILISTVRSTENHLVDDLRFTLGFVKNPKRLNVALTRAQVAVLLFCNPQLLCKDALWKKTISYAVRNDKYMGCNLPDDFESELNTVVL